MSTTSTIKACTHCKFATHIYSIKQDKAKKERVFFFWKLKEEREKRGREAQEIAYLTL